MTTGARVRAASVAVVAAAALGLAGCGGGSKAASTATTTTTTTTTTTAAPSSATAASAITSAWVTFFKGSTPAARRVALLQDGSQFRATIDAQDSSSLAKGASAKVTKVVVTSPTAATVHYSIADLGSTVLPNQTGTAVKQDGTWKVGDGSFCALLKLEGDEPAACSSSS